VFPLDNPDIRRCSPLIVWSANCHCYITTCLETTTRAYDSSPAQPHPNASPGTPYKSLPSNQGLNDTQNLAKVRSRIHARHVLSIIYICHRLNFSIKPPSIPTHLSISHVARHCRNNLPPSFSTRSDSFQFELSGSKASLPVLNQDDHHPLPP
jgi:hypothetical protein